MLAVSEPEDEGDDLSEEGQRNLQNYLKWQAVQENNLQNNEILNLFGNHGGVSVP